MPPKPILVMGLIVVQPASLAILSKMSEMNEFMIPMPLVEMPVSGCTCLSTL